jgi:hypothetical protein
MRIPALLMLGFTAMVTSVSASGQQVAWHRSDSTTKGPITVFHSPQAPDLPTAATIGRRQWQFEISHRFQPPFSTGAGSLWGLDGPIYNRLGISYGVMTGLMVHVVRSNLQDNVELGGKLRFLEGGRGSIPFQVALAGGYAWNTAVRASDGPAFANNESQAYLQLVMNALVRDRLAVGIVPSLLHNPRIADATTSNELTVGVNGTFFLNKYLSLIGQWNGSPSRQDLEHDAVSFGLQIETGGHFFKLLATNSTRPNPTQFLGGTPYRFNPKALRFAFNVTR